MERGNCFNRRVITYCIARNGLRISKGVFLGILYHFKPGSMRLVPFLISDSVDPFWVRTCQLDGYIDPLVLPIEAMYLESHYLIIIGMVVDDSMTSGPVVLLRGRFFPVKYC